MSDTWFNEVEDVVYTAVEYIQPFGTLYSVKRAGIAYSEHDWKRYWQSVANSGTESAIRDAYLLSTDEELVPVVIIHPMVEAVTDSFIELYFTHDSETPYIGKMRTAPNKDLGYVVIPAKSNDELEESVARIFTGEMKGVHQFYRSQFVGTLTHPQFAPHGVEVNLSLPAGLQAGGRCVFIWRWTVDKDGASNRPEQVFAKLRLAPGTPSRFGLEYRRGAGWGGYDFWGAVHSTNLISAFIRIGEADYPIEFTRRTQA